MNIANIGIGAGAFMGGLSGGIKLGRQLKQVRNENEIEGIRKTGLASAELEREHQITGQVKMLPAQEELGEIKYQVGDQTFNSMGDARKAAGDNVDSVMDLFMQSTAPKIREAYVAQGDIEKADSWENWVESRTGKAAIRSWTKGYVAVLREDWDQAAKNFGTYYSKYIDGSATYSGHKLAKDDSGNVTGFVMELKDRKTGKVSEMPIGRDDFVALGMLHNPQANFDNLYGQSLTADKARLSDARDQRKFDREQGGRIELEREKARLREKSGGHKPSDIAKAEWLLTQGIAKDANDAWNKVRRSTAMGRERFAMEYARTEKANSNPYAGDSKSTDDLIQEGLILYDRLQEEDGATGGGARQPQGRPVIDEKTNQVIFR